LFEVDPTDAVAADDLERRTGPGVPGPGRGEQERVPGVEQPLHQHRRRLVQQREIVDEQHEPPGAGLFVHRRDHRCEAGGDIRFGGRVAASQQVRERPEGHLAGQRRRRRPGYGMASLLGDPEALLRQPGLAHAGAPEDARATARSVPQGAGEGIELGLPADERPADGQRPAVGSGGHARTLRRAAARSSHLSKPKVAPVSGARRRPALSSLP
jgi:hypothetical protein